MHISDTRHWYKEPWVWLMISLPLSAVIAGMITIYLAVSTSDGLVVDDYYKRGKEINRVLARDALAARYQLRAEISLDLRDNLAQVRLQGELPAQLHSLTLSLLHPTRDGFDQVLPLQHIGDGLYSGWVDEVGRGRWYLQLETDEWRLLGSMQVPAEQAIVLLPQSVAAPQ